MSNCLKEFLAYPEQAETFVKDFLGMGEDDAGDIEHFLTSLKALIGQQTTLTSQLIRLAAAHSALGSFFGRLDAHLLEPFYRNGIISLETAIIAAKNQTLDFDSCNAFVALAPHFDLQQLDHAIATVENLNDDYHQQIALGQLYPYLDKPLSTQKAVALYPELASEQHASDLHVTYWPLLPKDVRHAAILEALDNAITMKMSKYATAEYLLGIIPWLSKLSRDEICQWLLKWTMAAQLDTSGETLERLQHLELSEAIAEVAILENRLALAGFDGLYSSAERSFLATSSLAHLPEDLREMAVSRWLDKLYASNNFENQAGGLAGLAPYLDAETRTQAIAHAWASAEKVSSVDTKALLMTMIAQQMPLEQQAEKMREALRQLGSYRYMSASKAILNTLSSFPHWGVKLILEQEYRYCQHIDDDLHIRTARIAFNPHCFTDLVNVEVLDKLISWWIAASQLEETPLLKHILDVMPEPQRTETIQQIITQSTTELPPRALAFSFRCLLPHIEGQQQAEALQQLSEAVWNIGKQEEYMHEIATIYGPPKELSYLVGLTDQSARLKTATAAFSAMIALAKESQSSGLKTSAYNTDRICRYLKIMLPYLDTSITDLLLDTAKVGLPDYNYWPVASILFPFVSKEKQAIIQALLDSDELVLSRRDTLPIVYGSIKAKGGSLIWQNKSDIPNTVQSLLVDIKRLPEELILPLLCDWAGGVDEPFRTQLLQLSVSKLSTFRKQRDIKSAITTLLTRLPKLSPSEEQWLCTQVLIYATHLRRVEFLDTLHSLKSRLANCGMIPAVSEALDTVHRQFPSLDDTFKFNEVA
ncbi:MAG: hypothetical protein AAGD25_10915 [Cyanobacteria bacterium P01_F01_bin.150]